MGVEIEVKSQKSKVKSIEFLFSETGGFVCEVAKDKEVNFVATLAKFGVVPIKIGQTIDDSQFKVGEINLKVEEMAKTWLEGLRSKL
jgi:phosphoribosylformylglycinamidine (FGAM) synthase-like enzyme